MDLEDDTTILSTLKSFNTFISRPERPQLPSERSAGSGVLQSQYKRSMEVQINHLLWKQNSGINDNHSIWLFAFPLAHY